MRRILVIIVSYNIDRWLDRCLGSVRDSGADCIVIDNASTDGSPERIRREYPFVKLVEAGRNLGFGAANNIGIRYALEQGYDYAYLLNGDAWLMPGTLDAICKAFESDEGREYGILSPLQFAGNGDAFDRLFEKHCGKALRANPTKEVVPVRFVMAAHWMLIRRCFEAVGGFSPAFSHNGEDDNYIDRARFYGFKVGVVPSAQAVHDRQGRKTSRESAMRLKCVGTVAKVSNPCAFLPWRLLWEPIELVGMSIYRRSMQILRFIPALIGKYPELIRLRRESKTSGAFLEDSTLLK